MGAIEFKQVKKTFKDGAHTIEALKKTDFAVEKRRVCRYYRPIWFWKEHVSNDCRGIASAFRGRSID